MSGERRTQTYPLHIILGCGVDKVAAATRLAASHITRCCIKGATALSCCVHQIDGFYKKLLRGEFAVTGRMMI